MRRGAVGPPSTGTFALRIPTSEEHLALSRSSRGTGDDLELMLRIANGEGAALELLYDRYCSAVMGLCVRILGDPAEAEDTVIDVFQQIWERAGHFEPTRATPLSYLMTIARSRAIDRLRAHRRRTRLVVLARNDDDLESFSAVSPAASPFDGTLASEVQRRILLSLSRLRPDEREAVELSFLLGLSHAEIADRLGVPLGTVKTRIRQGLIRLRDDLATDNAEEVG